LQAITEAVHGQQGAGYLSGGLADRDADGDRGRRLAPQLGQPIAQARLEGCEYRRDRMFVSASLCDSDDDPIVGKHASPSAGCLHTALQLLEHRLEQLDWRRIVLQRLIEECLEPRMQASANFAQSCGHTYLLHSINPSSFAAITRLPAIGAAARAP
jgi:hypothetical protein